MKLIKPTIYSILILLSSTIYFLLVVKGCQEQNIEIDKLPTHSGRVVSVGEIIRKSSNHSAKVFYVELEGLDQVLGVYRKSKNYDNLLEAIHTNDSLTVYFMDNSTDDINIDLIQIEKNSKIILEKAEFEDKESALIWIGLIGGLFSVFLSINYYYNNVLSKRKGTYR